MAYMSQEGYDKLVAQLKEMETIERPAASAAIAEARDKGDLSENSEYDAAKEMRNVKNNMKMAYTIVSETEANLKEGKISVQTPIAQGLLGKKVGDVAEIKIPHGTVQLEITNISFE